VFAVWYMDSYIISRTPCLVRRRLVSRWLLVTRSSPVDALEHQCRQFESDPLRDTKRKSGVTCSSRMALNTRRAPAFITAWSWLSRLAGKPAIVRRYRNPIWTGLVTPQALGRCRLAQIVWLHVRSWRSMPKHLDAALVMGSVHMLIDVGI